MSQNEQKQEDDNVNVLTKEIESGSNFEYALREEIDFSLTKCFLNVKKMNATSKLLTPKMSSHLNHCLWC